MEVARAGAAEVARTGAAEGARGCERPRHARVRAAEARAGAAGTAPRSRRSPPPAPRPPARAAMQISGVGKGLMLRVPQSRLVLTVKRRRRLHCERSGTRHATSSVASTSREALVAAALRRRTLSDWDSSGPASGVHTGCDACSARAAGDVLCSCAMFADWQLVNQAWRAMHPEMLLHVNGDVILR